MNGDRQGFGTSLIWLRVRGDGGRGRISWRSEADCNYNKKISYPMHEGPKHVLFLYESIVQNFEKLCHFGSYSYIQAYVVTISHLDTWFTLVLLTINILTLFQ